MQSHRQPNENLGRGVQQAVPTPEFEITRQSAVLAMRANVDQTRRARVPRIVPVAASVPSSASLFDRIWSPAVLFIGLVLTLAWTALLGYGVVNAVALAF
jgi:hypothetical protein